MDQIVMRGSDEPSEPVGLGEMLRRLSEESGEGLKDLTVLSGSIDPFRLDTPANHKKGAWFRDALKASRSEGLNIRSIHYAVGSVGVLKLDGTPYRNNYDDWQYLQNDASKAARWLGYVPFSAVSDARNSDPIIRIARKGGSLSTVNPPSACDLPGIEEFRFKVVTFDYVPVQNYRLVIFGEKASVERSLKPIAEKFDADLYLSSGEITDSLLYTMAKVGAEDGREMVVFVVADCDPAGYQMSVSIAHKLRALKEMLFPGLRFRVEAVALTVEQVKEHGLPSKPLKETERRAAGWFQRYGVEQCEIDSIATLEPELFCEIVETAMSPYFDFGLKRRVWAAFDEWNKEANRRLDEALERANLGEAYAEMEASLQLAKNAVEVLESRRWDVKVDLPPTNSPTSDLCAPPASFISSEMPLLDAIRVLKARKDYGGRS